MWYMLYVNDIINRTQDRDKETARTTCSYVKGFHILPTEYIHRFSIIFKIKFCYFLK
jgi:hypothetical protein